MYVYTKHIYEKNKIKNNNNNLAAKKSGMQGNVAGYKKTPEINKCRHYYLNEMQFKGSKVQLQQL